MYSMNSFKSKIDILYNLFISEIEKINNFVLSPSYISNLIIKTLTGKKNLSDISYITLYKKNILKVEVFNKNNISYIKKSILKFDNSVIFNIEKNILYLEFKNLFLYSKEDKNKKIHNELNNFKKEYRLIRHKFLEFQKKVLNKDDFIKFKKEIECYYEIYLIKINKYIE